MELLKKVQRIIIEFGTIPALALVAGIALIIALIFAIFGYVDSKALIGFFGVLLGSSLTSLTSLLSAKDNRRLQLSVAALDKRLQAHQSAYAIWYEMIWAIHHPEKIGELIKKADEFWVNNCLYLDPVSREAFRDSIIFASSHKGLLEGPRDKDAIKLIKESWKTIMKPGKTLPEGVYLPSLGINEYPNFAPENPKN